MSYQNIESLAGELKGLGIGIPLVLAGLVFTIGNIWLGAGAGIPLILLGIVVPLFMTNEARQEAARQELRQQRNNRSNPADGYNISSKHLKRRRH